MTPRPLFQPLRRFWRDRRGGATAEFVISLPVLFFLFVAGLELAYMMIRATSLDRALDLTIRDLRLGVIRNPSVTVLERAVCARTSVLPNCAQSLVLEFTVIDPATWALPGATAPCIRRTPELQAGRAAESYTTGLENQLMLVRACVVVDAISPLPGEVDYRLWAASAFVNEPN